MKLTSPPIIQPAANLLPYTVTASDSRRYRLTPNGVRSFRNPAGRTEQCVTFSYRRIGTGGQPIQRIRMSKKNRLRLRRKAAFLNEF